MRYVGSKTVPYTAVPEVPRILWLVLALTFPLFSVEWFRISFGGYIAVPTVAMNIIIYVGVLVVFMHGKIRSQPKHRVLLIVVVCLFLLCHLVALPRAVQMQKAVLEVSKLIFGILSMWTVAHLFPRDLDFHGKFWLIVILGSTALMLYLIYIYVFVYHLSYLGNKLIEELGPTGDFRHGRNMLSWYLSLVLPYAVAFLLVGKATGRARILIIVSNLTLISAWIYVGSRAAWISVVCGLVAMVYSNRRFQKMTYLKQFIPLLLLGLVGYWVLVMNIGELESYRRFIYLFDPDSIPELRSYGARSTLILDVLKRTLESPFFGIGLTNTKYIKWPHNDYVTILGDMGIIGLGLFLSLLWILLARVWSVDPTSKGEIHYTLLGVRGALVSTSVYMIFTDTYTIPPFWIFLGFCWATNTVEIQKRKLT